MANTKQYCAEHLAWMRSSLLPSDSIDDLHLLHRKACAIEACIQEPVWRVTASEPQPAEMQAALPEEMQPGYTPNPYAHEAPMVYGQKAADAAPEQPPAPPEELPVLDVSDDAHI